MIKEKLTRSHTEKFKKTPDILVFAPGRVNFIGEHTDYNGGLVMPLALDLGVFAAISRNTLGLLRILSLDFNKYTEFEMARLAPEKTETWANCPKGMVRMLIDAGHPITGLDLTMTGNLPMNAGLSSSAAAEVAAGFAVKELFGLKIEGLALALLAQKAEHAFTGTLCGIMDQAISVMGKKDTLFRLSCQNLRYDYIPFNLNGLELLIINSGVKHNLAQGEYNVRRRECAEAFAVALTIKPGMETLSDFSVELLEVNKARFPGTLYPRARHVLGENTRVMATGESLAKGDFAAVGRCMTESHRSLQRDYAVSCAELDFLVDHALEQKGVLGARMTGGGFGGCVIVLLKNEAEQGYRRTLEDYQKQYGVAPQVFKAIPSDGARRV